LKLQQAIAPRAVFIEPLMEIADVDGNEIPNCKTIIITSRHAISCVSKIVDKAGITFFVVGHETADALINAGFTNIAAVYQNVDELVSSAKILPSPIFYPSGEIISRDLKLELGVRGIDVIHRVVYRTVEKQRLSDSCINHLKNGKITAATFFSSHTAEIFLELCAMHNLEYYLKSVAALTLSAKIAKLVDKAPWKSLVVCDNPSLISMKMLIKEQKW